VFSLIPNHLRDSVFCRSPAVRRPFSSAGLGACAGGRAILIDDLIPCQRLAWKFEIHVSWKESGVSQTARSLYLLNKITRLLHRKIDTAVSFSNNFLHRFFGSIKHIRNILGFLDILFPLRMRHQIPSKLQRVRPINL
jgi:hypothetical protein